MAAQKPKLYLTLPWPAWLDMAQAQNPDVAENVQAVLNGQKDTVCLPVDVAVKLAETLDDKAKQRALKTETRAKMRKALGGADNPKAKIRVNRLLGKSVEENLAVLARRARYDTKHLIEWLDELNAKDYQTALAGVGEHIDRRLAGYILDRWTTTGDGISMLDLAWQLDSKNLYRAHDRLLEEIKRQWQDTGGFKNLDLQTRGNLIGASANRRNNITKVDGDVLVEAVKQLAKATVDTPMTWWSIGYMSSSELVGGENATYIVQHVSELEPNRIAQFMFAVERASRCELAPTGDLVREMAVRLVNNHNTKPNVTAAMVLPEDLIQYLNPNTMTASEILQAAVGRRELPAMGTWLAERQASALMKVLAVVPWLDGREIEKILKPLEGNARHYFLNRMCVLARRMPVERTTSRAMMVIWRETVRLKGLQATYNVGRNPVKTALNSAIGELLWEEVSYITDTPEEKRETLACASGLLGDWEGTLTELAHTGKRIARAGKQKLD